MLRGAISQDRLDEAQLIRAAKYGDEEAVAHLARCFVPLRRLIAAFHRQIDPAGTMRADLESAATLAILEALERFDPDRGVRFVTFAYQRIRGAMLRTRYPGSRRESESSRERVELVPLETVDESGAIRTFEQELMKSDPNYGQDRRFTDIEREEARLAVSQFVEGLPGNQREITIDLFYTERSYTEVARARGVSRPAISRTMARVSARGQRELVAEEFDLAA